MEIKSTIALIAILLEIVAAFSVVDKGIAEDGNTISIKISPTEMIFVSCSECYGNLSTLLKCINGCNKYASIPVINTTKRLTFAGQPILWERHTGQSADGTISTEIRHGPIQRQNTSTLVSNKETDLLLEIKEDPDETPTRETRRMVDKLSVSRKEMKSFNVDSNDYVNVLLVLLLVSLIILFVAVVRGYGGLFHRSKQVTVSKLRDPIGYSFQPMKIYNI